MCLQQVQKESNNQPQRTFPLAYLFELLYEHFITILIGRLYKIKVKFVKLQNKNILKYSAQCILQIKMVRPW